MADDHERDVATRYMAQRRGLPRTQADGSEWRLLDKLPPGARCRLLGYLHMVSDMPRFDGADFVALHVDQNPDIHPIMGAALPTLLTGSTLALIPRVPPTQVGVPPLVIM